MKIRVLYLMYMIFLSSCSSYRFYKIRYEELNLESIEFIKAEDIDSIPKKLIHDISKEFNIIFTTKESWYNGSSIYIKGMPNALIIEYGTDSISKSGYIIYESGGNIPVFFYFIFKINKNKILYYKYSNVQKLDIKTVLQRTNITNLPTQKPLR